jgi:succinylarginine dihydrolase
VKAETLIQRLRGVHRRERSKAERVVVSPASFLDHALYKSARHSVTAVRRLHVHALDLADRRTRRLERHASDRRTFQ